ncbi:hypothetical protein PCASD_07418 [Puccinia coronata f. sp. avenae]|uniref:Uncharacterized protein n=1 Tax=Puccinia coronata f. sp. avenae TaxID=200324 RepID=A0A2N5V9A2_9BASI|nr:hypothetical protein PCASD_07418 [Puccinia coronata f. sp. avenae]
MSLQALLYNKYVVCSRASDITGPCYKFCNQAPSTPPTGLAPFRTTMIHTNGLGHLRQHDDNHLPSLGHLRPTDDDYRPFWPTPAESNRIGHQIPADLRN